MTELEDLQFAMYLISQIDSSNILELYKFKFSNKNRYIAKINYYYVNSFILSDEDEKTAYELNYPYNDDNYDYSYRIEKITIDTFTDITEEIRSGVNETIDYLIKKGLIPHYEYPFPNDLTTRRRFNDFYETVKDLRYGECFGKAEKFNYFIEKIVEIYNLTNVGTIYFKNSKIVRRFISLDKNIKRILNSNPKKLEYFKNEEEKVRFSTFFLKNNFMHVDDSFIGAFNEITSKYVIVPLIIDFPGDSRTFNHQNVIIFDKERKEFERFEPEGGSVKKANDVIRKKFNELLPDYTYIEPLSYCPFKGPQLVIGADGCSNAYGFCVTISMIYVYLRIRNPEYTREEIVNVISGYGPFLLRKFNTYVDSLVENIIKV